MHELKNYVLIDDVISEYLVTKATKIASVCLMLVVGNLFVSNIILMFMYNFVIV